MGQYSLCAFALCMASVIVTVPAVCSASPQHHPSPRRSFPFLRARQDTVTSRAANAAAKPKRVPWPVKAAKFSGRVAVRLPLAYGILAGGAYMSNQVMASEPDTIVFSAVQHSDPGYRWANVLPPKVMTYGAAAFSLPPLLVNETLHGHRVKIVSNPSVQQVNKGLANPRYRNVVFLGHGAEGIFEASGGEAASSDGFQSYLADHKYRGWQRKESVLQLTCTLPSGYPSWGEVLLKHPDDRKHFITVKDNAIVSPLELVRGEWKLAGKSVVTTPRGKLFGLAGIGAGAVMSVSRLRRRATVENKETAAVSSR